jgi:hypothetical protein
MSDAPIWMFQYNPDNWDLERHLREHGDMDYWKVSAHWGVMDIGQQVYLMRSGTHAGLVAAGRLLGKSYPCDRGECRAHVDVLIEARIIPPLTRGEMRSDSILAQYRPFVVGEYRTNFILPDNVAFRTTELVQTRLEATSPQSDVGAIQSAMTLDARTRVNAIIVRRQGQPEFRRQLLHAYGHRCAISECDAVEALEAAHIRPYLGPQANNVVNGLLLRADIHTLFDLGLLAIDTATMTVLVAPALKATTYGALEGTQLRVPANPCHRPSNDGLDEHRRTAGL